MSETIATQKDELWQSWAKERLDYIDKKIQLGTATDNERAQAEGLRNGLQY